jgi:hypothetical protein
MLLFSISPCFKTCLPRPSNLSKIDLAGAGVLDAMTTVIDFNDFEMITIYTGEKMSLQGPNS